LLCGTILNAICRGATLNVAYGIALQKRPLPSTTITRSLALADLPANFAEQDSQNLSSGQAQRVTKG
jgi:ABC-type sulfate/molybdate transport systems ATPase subunit